MESVFVCRFHLIVTTHSHCFVTRDQRNVICKDYMACFLGMGLEYMIFYDVSP